MLLSFFLQQSQINPGKAKGRFERIKEMPSCGGKANKKLNMQPTE